MPIDSVAKFVELLKDSRLLDPPQLDELAKLQANFQDVKALARELVRRGWLTAFQVNQLVQGHGKDLVLGPYRLLERLGEGGMGQVFKARHQKMKRVAAVKVIRKDRLTNPDAVKRFYREIEAAAQLSHPNIVHAYDADEVNGTHFFAMEYVEGVDLAKLVKEQGPLSVPQACDCIRQAALGLQHAHERGLVHRDIGPVPRSLLRPARAPRVPVAQPSPADQGFVPLFNGKDLNGWKKAGDPTKGWKVERGVLTTSEEDRPQRLYSERGDFRDFHLRCEARISAAVVGGVFFRVPFNASRPSYSFTWDRVSDPKADKLQRMGTVDDPKTWKTWHAKAGPTALIPIDQWFTCEIIADGSHVILKVNDQLLLDIQDPEPVLQPGHILLTLAQAGGVMQFRKIEIKELPDKR